MKCNPWRWLWGIPLLGMWLWITVLAERDNIQDDLRTRSLGVLQQAGLGWAGSAFAGRDGFVSGRTADPDLPDKAVAVVRDVWGVRVAQKDVDLIDVVTSYEWSARRTSDALTLAGYVPSLEDREKIIEIFQTRFPNTKILDEMVVTAGVPDKSIWMSGVTFAANQLRALKTGGARINNLNLVLNGEAKDFVSYKAVKGALAQGMPSGVVLAKDGVTPPVVAPYTWAAKRSKTELLLTGHVPSEKLRKDVFVRAKDLFKNLAVVDRMQTGAGAPEKYSQAAFVSLAQLARLQNGTVEMTGATMKLSGRVADKKIADEVRRVWKDDVPGTFELSEIITYPPPKPDVVSPYTTTLTAEPTRLFVDGYVPNEDARKDLLAKISTAFPEKTVIDRLSLASGNLEGWAPCLAAGVGGLQKLGEGVVQLRDNNMLVVGKSKDEAIANGLGGEVRTAANRACQTEVRVALDVPPEPSLEWSASHQADGRIVLNGDVPDAATKAALITKAGALFTGAEVVDQMNIVSVPPRNWQATAVYGLEQLARLRKGKAVISRQSLSVSGEAGDTAVANAVKGRMSAGLPSGYGGRHNITVRSDAQIWAEEEARKKAEVERQAAKVATEVEAAKLRKAEADAEAARLAAERKQIERERLQAEADAKRLSEEAQEKEASRAARLKQKQQEAKRCEDLLRSTAAEGTIRFALARANLTAKSRPTLNKLVKIVKDCPNFKIEIEGHTDSQGLPTRNMSLSEKRAQSVVDYLKKQGVDGKRLTAVGYGETRPIASNETAVGRAKNRRIEFSIKVN